MKNIECPECGANNSVSCWSDDCVERIKNNEYLDNNMRSVDGYLLYKNKAIIQLVEEIK